jgi:tetratricopeptide (TPR) repeat protein
MSNRSVPAEPLAQARAAAAAGDLDGLAACAAAALGADLAPVVRVDIANCCRDAGHPNLAEPILSALKAERPDYPPPYYELAFIRRQAGRHAEAAFELEDGLRACGRDERLGLAHAHMLYMAGAHERADAALARLDPATPGAAASLRALLEFGQFLRDHPRDGALFQLASLRRARSEAASRCCVSATARAPGPMSRRATSTPIATCTQPIAANSRACGSATAWPGMARISRPSPPA